MYNSLNKYKRRHRTILIKKHYFMQKLEEGIHE